MASCPLTLTLALTRPGPCSSRPQPQATVTGIQPGPRSTLHSVPCTLLLPSLCSGHKSLPGS